MLSILAGVKGYLYAAAAAALIIGALWLHQWSYDRGVNAVKTADAKTLAAQIAKDNAAILAAEHANDAEIASLQAYVDSHPIQPVQLCLNTGGSGPVPSPGSPNTSPAPGPVQPVSPGNSGVRTGPGPDISSLLSLLAERADQLSAELRDYQSVVK